MSSAPAKRAAIYARVSTTEQNPKTQLRELRAYAICRVHQTLRVTPAMEAGVADRLWDVQDLVRLLEPSPRN